MFSLRESSYNYVVLCYRPRSVHDNKVLEDLPGVICLMDDIILFGESPEEHGARVRTVFRRLEDSGVTLNSEKCEFAKSSITYLGHVVSADGIRADLSKVRAINIQ